MNQVEQSAQECVIPKNLLSDEAPTKNGEVPSSATIDTVSQDTGGTQMYSGVTKMNSGDEVQPPPNLTTESAGKATAGGEVVSRGDRKTVAQVLPAGEKNGSETEGGHAGRVEPQLRKPLGVSEHILSALWHAVEMRKDENRAKFLRERLGITNQEDINLLLVGLDKFYMHDEWHIFLIQLCLIKARDLRKSNENADKNKIDTDGVIKSVENAIDMHGFYISAGHFLDKEKEHFLKELIDDSGLIDTAKFDGIYPQRDFLNTWLENVGNKSVDKKGIIGYLIKSLSELMEKELKHKAQEKIDNDRRGLIGRYGLDKYAREKGANEEVCKGIVEEMMRIFGIEYFSSTCTQLYSEAINKLRGFGFEELESNKEAVRDALFLRRVMMTWGKASFNKFRLENITGEKIDAYEEYIYIVLEEEGGTIRNVLEKDEHYRITDEGIKEYILSHKKSVEMQKEEMQKERRMGRWRLRALYASGAFLTVVLVAGGYIKYSDIIHDALFNGEGGNAKTLVVSPDENSAVAAAEGGNAEVVEDNKNGNIVAAADEEDEVAAPAGALGEDETDDGENKQDSAGVQNNNKQENIAAGAVNNIDDDGMQSITSDMDDDEAEVTGGDDTDNKAGKDEVIDDAGQNQSGNTVSIAGGDDDEVATPAGTLEEDEAGDGKNGQDTADTEEGEGQNAAQENEEKTCIHPDGSFEHEGNTFIVEEDGMLTMGATTVKLEDKVLTINNQGEISEVSKVWISFVPEEVKEAIRKSAAAAQACEVGEEKQATIQGIKDFLEM